MSTWYFQKALWKPFVYQGATYELAHLNEYQFSVIDTDAMERCIVVSFSDHCFTRDHEANDEPALIYPESSRNPGVFSLDRYRHSLNIVGHIANAAKGKVWNASRYHGYQDNFAAIPTVDNEGRSVLYAIIFSLERSSKDVPVDLHMRIRSAYPCDQKPIPTFGEVRFSKLVALCMKGKTPVRITEPTRKKPRLS